MDHQAEFKLLVMEQLGKPASDALDWSSPRLVCIAADFTKYDAHAVQQINRNIELIRYRRFGEELLLLELVNATSASNDRSAITKPAKKQRPRTVEPPARVNTADRGYADWVPLLPAHLTEVIASLEGYVLSLGDDVQRKELKLYVAFKRLKNFATVVPQKNRLAVGAFAVGSVEAWVRHCGDWPRQLRRAAFDWTPAVADRLRPVLALNSIRSIPVANGGRADRVGSARYGEGLPGHRDECRH
ncbi:MAG: hypothetical protein KDI60_01760 [Xanthomonadales bacterium]|nr:hypothetical protein [Xanthomonadales bacterium]MCB1610498.1 hypothetical protein [Xanthomonadales bacterium]